MMKTEEIKIVENSSVSEFDYFELEEHLEKFECTLARANNQSKLKDCL